jgi:hypothetical protein
MSSLISFDRLGRMNWKYNELSLDTQKIMAERFIVFLQEGDAVGLSSLLNGFQEMEYHWTENDLVKEAIFAGIVNHFGNGNTNTTAAGRELANIIFYLGQSDLQWKDIRTDVQDSLFRGISQCSRSFSAQGISNIIHG